MSRFLCLFLMIHFSFTAFANEAATEHHATPQVAPAHKAAHSEHKREAGPIKAVKALQFLQNGNHRYLTNRSRKAGATKAERQSLVAGQKPHTIILSCSDSRVPPEIVFDQRLGEIFIIRTAGQSLDFAAIASIEYAVSHLGTNLIVVMGHESCGAVKAALGTLKGGDAGSIWLNKLVKDLHPHLKRFSDLTPTDGVIVESWANVEGVAKDLVERSEIVRRLVNSGEITIQNALYHLGSGEVEWR